MPFNPLNKKFQRKILRRAVSPQLTYNQPKVSYKRAVLNNFLNISNVLISLAFLILFIIFFRYTIVLEINKCSCSVNKWEFQYMKYFFLFLILLNVFFVFFFGLGLLYRYKILRQILLVINIVSVAIIFSYINKTEKCKCSNRLEKKLIKYYAIYVVIVLLYAIFSPHIFSLIKKIWR